MSTLLDRPPVTPADCLSASEPLLEPHPYTAGRTYTPNYRVLCSIIPNDLLTYLRHALGRKEYYIPAVPKGKYALLRVYDTYQVIADLSGRATNDDGHGDDMQAAPVHCDGVCDDLLRIFSGDAVGNRDGQMPGLMVIQGDEPDQGELDRLWSQHESYCRYLVQQADDFETKGLRSYITEEHRRALDWLGSEDRTWYRKILATREKDCPACAELINRMATRCKVCGIDIEKWYRDKGIEVTEDLDLGVWTLLQRIKSQPKK